LDRVSIYAQATLGCDLPIYTFSVAGITAVNHHVQVLFGMWSHEHFAQTSLKQ
jgi:hypothetical protein